MEKPIGIIFDDGDMVFSRHHDKPLPFFKRHARTHRIMAVSNRVDERRPDAACQDSFNSGHIHSGFGTCAHSQYPWMVGLDYLLEAVVGQLLDKDAASRVEQ